MLKPRSQDYSPPEELAWPETKQNGMKDHKLQTQGLITKDVVKLVQTLRIRVRQSSKYQFKVLSSLYSVS